MFPKDQTNLSAYTIDFLIWHPHTWRGASLLNIPIMKPYL